MIRRIVAFLGCGALLLAAGVLTAPTASATVTTLCTGYTACTKAGMSDSGYGAASKTMYWRMYDGHNCTNYAAYRMVRSGLPNTRPWTGSGNATNWGVAMHTITNSTPMVGAVAWWKAGVKPAGSAGHVAYVEKVVSSSEIIVSMDSWHGDFSWARVTKTTSGWPSGFIHFNDVHLRATVVPKVTGTAKVGSLLTATPGTWAPALAGLTYQWMADGVAIGGATTSTFTATTSQVGKKLSVQVKASGSGYPTTTAVSAATAAVLPGVLTRTSAARVAGEAKVGEVLRAVPATWAPTPDKLSYQWLADGATIAGADQATLAVGPDLMGKALSVQVTATKAGFPAAVATSSALDPVAHGTFAVSSTPRIAGAARPGQVLTVVLPGIRPASAVAVQWLRDGVPIGGATSRTYHVGSADLGTRLVALLRLTRTGYAPAQIRSATTQIVRVTPTLQVSARAGTHRLVVRAVVRAPGVRSVQGVLAVRSRAGFYRKLTIRNGVAQATLGGVHAGVRKFRFRVVPSTTMSTVMVARRLTIR